ncbi:DDE-type integrase/transposase/recombinase [Aureimonas ureilytica]|uniref:DDE-type integrase/transposase/recombinase n=1 Tax=Aureimonas ureilytica TaxID=401562 RepID=UPI003D2F2B90
MTALILFGRWSLWKTRRGSVRGEGMYLYRAIGRGGETLDFHLLRTRTTKAAKQFLSKALNRSPHRRPSVIPSNRSA